jgi:hypothetical protein
MITFTVGNFSVIDPKPGATGLRAHPMIRFAVTIVKDGTPWWTSEGWRMSRDRAIWPPTTFPGGNIGRPRWSTFNQLHQDFETVLRQGVLSFPGVVEELGTQIERPVPKPKAKKKGKQLPGEPQVFLREEQ